MYRIGGRLHALCAYKQCAPLDWMERGQIAHRIVGVRAQPSYVPNWVSWAYTSYSRFASLMFDKVTDTLFA